jgi:hypothetical protein
LIESEIDMQLLPFRRFVESPESSPAQCARLIARKETDRVKFYLRAVIRHKCTSNLTSNVLSAIAIGGAVGLALGISSEKYIQSLLYQVKPADPYMMALPASALLGVMALAMLHALARALSIDPSEILRSE